MTLTIGRGGGDIVLIDIFIYVVVGVFLACLALIGLVIAAGAVALVLAPFILAYVWLRKKALGNP